VVFEIGSLPVLRTDRVGTTRLLPSREQPRSVDPPLPQDYPLAPFCEKPHTPHARRS